VQVERVVILLLILVALLGAAPVPAQDPDIPAEIDGLRHSLDFHSGPSPKTLADLGPEAIPALLDFIREMRDEPRYGAYDQPRREVALQALKAMGTEGKSAIPGLLAILGNPSEKREFRSDVVMALMSINQSPELVVPALANALDGELVDRSGLAHWIIRALATLGPQARSAVPALTRAVGNCTDKVAVDAALALIDIEGTLPKRSEEEASVRAAIVDHELKRGVQCADPGYFRDWHGPFCDHCPRPAPKVTFACTRAEVEAHINRVLSTSVGELIDLQRVAWLGDRRAHFTTVDPARTPCGSVERTFLLEKYRGRWRVVSVQARFACETDVCIPPPGCREPGDLPSTTAIPDQH
jgi:hypothetical protein